MKKRKIISIISSILCSFAFVGLFAIGLFVDYKQKPQQASADNSTLIYRNGINSVISFSKVTSGVTYNSAGYFSGSYEYFQSYEEGQARYRFRLRFSLYFEFYLDNVTYKYRTIENNEEPFFVDVDFYTTDVTTQENAIDFEFLGYGGGSFINRPLIFSLNSQLAPMPYYLYPASSNDTLPSGYSIGTFIRNYNLSLGSIANVIDESFIPSNYDDYNNGYTAGYEVGYDEGNNNGNAEGYANGFVDGKQQQAEEDQALLDDYYAQGYAAGYNEGTSQDATVTSIFNGITSVALVPVKFFLSIFNFEILGVNIASVVSALMSICIILIVWRSVMGGKSDD